MGSTNILSLYDFASLYQKLLKIFYLSDFSENSTPRRIRIDCPEHTVSPVVLYIGTYLHLGQLFVLTIAPPMLDFDSPLAGFRFIEPKPSFV